ncbi:sugar transferase [Altererythrobacter sp.]|uniref:sugar transferase n=1 Tax=Altererythrobacter sp. TaxID=1872480 RepID=UPI003D0C78E9
MKRPPVPLATAKSAPLMGVAEQLAFYLTVGIAIPAIIWSALRGIPLSSESIRLFLAELAACNAACWYSMRRLRTYARARLLSYVLPVNLACFGALLAIVSLARAPFSVTLYVPCALATLAISYLVTARIRHASPNLRHYVVPFGDVESLFEHSGFERAVSVEQIDGLIDERAVAGSIVADLHTDHSPEWERLFAKAALQGIPVYHYRLLEEAITGQVSINHLRENELGSLIPNLPYRALKRVSDVVFSVALSPFLVPALGLIALAVKLDSPGPILFKQQRVGFRGESFEMVKFRTMRVVDHETDEHARREQTITKDGDNRITRTGRFLRKVRLDELPQVWNILLGEMSWIGPRPEARELADWYEAEIPFYSYRHIVRPGITGWAQVNQGHVADLDSVKAKLRFDFYYVKNLSLWLDILIALKTLRVVVQGIGAK